MPQEIYVVSIQWVIDILDHQKQCTPLNYMLDWGNIGDETNLQQLKDQLKALKARHKDYVDIAAVANVLQSWETRKLLGGANRMLDRIFAIAKTMRVALSQVLNENAPPDPNLELDPNDDFYHY